VEPSKTHRVDAALGFMNPPNPALLLAPSPSLQPDVIAVDNNENILERTCYPDGPHNGASKRKSDGNPFCPGSKSSRNRGGAATDDDDESGLNEFDEMLQRVMRGSENRKSASSVNGKRQAR
jgi:hypothetical protein